MMAELNVYERLREGDLLQFCQLECEEEAVWVCSPLGMLATKIFLCDGHKREVERQEAAREQREGER